jgi:hypothetical protein
MTEDIAKLAARLRKSGEQELERWMLTPAGIWGFIPVVSVVTVDAIFWLGHYSRFTEILAWIALILSAIAYLWLSDITSKKWVAFSKPFVASWRPQLEAHFRENLHQRGLLSAIISGELSSELRSALSPETWPERERPLESLWLKTNLTTPKRRILGLLRHYVRCCQALALEPFPAGFMQRTLRAQLWFWINGDLWPAVLRVVVAGALELDAAPATARE